LAVVLDIYDPYNNAVKTINGQSVTGPLKGYRNLRYVPRGAIINQAGTCSFELPMSLRNNAPIGPRTMVRVTDTELGLQGTYMVGERSETPADDARYASFTCLDQVNELTLDTVPGLSAFSDSNEPTAGTLNRILRVPFQTPYSSTMVNGTDYYAGIDFLADNVTVQAAFSKLLGDRGFGWRRGDGRIIEYGTFKRPTGIRLVQASGRPAAMNRANIRPIPVNGLRTVLDPTAIYNCIPITGAGSGPYQHSLQPLYVINGETAVSGTNWYRTGPWPIPPPAGQPWFPGYDNNYPIHRRITYNGRGSDGYEYFLVDWNSVNRYRPSFYPLNRSDVGSTDNTSDDLTDTAQALYIIAWATLQLSAKVNTAISVTTVGRGNNVGIGGDIVTVEWQSFEEDGQLVPSSSFDRAPFVVLGVECAIDDSSGARTDTWSLSDIGRAPQSDIATETGMLESIQQMKNAVSIYPVEKDIHRDEPITPASPVSVTISMNQRYQKVQVSRWNIQLTSIYSTVTGGNVAEHSHGYTIPNLSIDASTPVASEQQYNPINQGLHSHVENISANRTPTNFTDAITAGRSSGVTKGGSATGGGSVSDASSVGNVSSTLGGHHHSITITAGGPLSSVGQKGIIFSDSTGGAFGGLFLQMNSWGGQLYTNPSDVPSINSAHGHGSSFSVSDGIRVDDTLGVARGGTLTDNLGVSRGGTFNGVNGFQPDTWYPGYSNLITRTYTGQTSATATPAWTPVYGKFSAPSSQKPTNVRIWIAQSVVAGPFNSDQVDIDLRSYFQTRSPVTLTFTSDTVGRIIIDGTIEASKTIYASNAV